MGDIYSRASLVNIWLSTSAPKQSDEDEFMDNLQASLALFYIRQFEGISSFIAKRLSLYANHAAERSILLCVATREIPKRPYFERSWIIQEIVLGTSVCILYWRMEIDWIHSLAAGNMISNLASMTDDGDTRLLSTSLKLVNIGRIHL